MKNTRAAGWHLTMDALVSDAARISDPASLRGFITELVDLLRMTILDGPRVTEVDLDPTQLLTDNDEGGITGYCLITTSHLSIHTWPLRKRFCLDIFSCKSFDGEAAAQRIREQFGVVDDCVHWFAREWPAATGSSALPVTAIVAADTSATLATRTGIAAASLSTRSTARFD